MVLEKDIEAKLRRGVKAQGGISYKWVSPGTAGVPDRIVIWPNGIVEFVELKTDTGKLSKLQEVQIARLRAMGCCVCVLYGVDDVSRYLGERS